MPEDEKAVYLFGGNVSKKPDEKTKEGVTKITAVEYPERSIPFLYNVLSLFIKRKEIYGQ